SLKRKRATSVPCAYTMSARNTSPKRPRRDTDTEILPTHSVSAAGVASNVSALTLNETNTFSPSSSQFGTRSPRRANSPPRKKIAVLASASPPTITKPSLGLKKPLPQKVRDVKERLGEGLDKGWIPVELRKLIEEDTDFGDQQIKSCAWGESATSNFAVERETLLFILRKVKKIWLNACVCQLKGRDENAWCMDVIKPLIKLAMKLEG
ncbi:hypothetical protein GQ44DRAFT_579865, partial [Phaeosphaeriaceae sp. PMI808]